MSAPVEDDQSSVSDTSSPVPLDLQPDTEWQDVEADDEGVEITSLFSDARLANPQAFLDDCKANGLDLASAIRSLELEFYSAVKLVNYLRHQAQQSGSAALASLDLSTTAPFEDDKFLQPVLPDDALLFCLDDLLALAEAATSSTSSDAVAPLKRRIRDLEDQLATLETNFSAYRATVASTLDQRWGAADPAPHDDDATAAAAAAAASAKRKPYQDNDSGYFASYAESAIHETMLKDTPRTASYRDFIYAHKPLFHNKTVLDVGCGTGILSLFSARAGAARVFAVDNSGIVDKARKIVATNGLEGVVKVVRGKIEDVRLPWDDDEGDAKKEVDVLVSEWMGYALLYEAMLPSVLRARDAYLSPGGVMAPSHCTMLLAPLADADYVADSVGFWGDVYGFDMRTMTEGIYDEVIVQPVKTEALAGPGEVFKVLDLHTVRNPDLDFESSFTLEITKDVDMLDGFVIWFDTFFLPTREAQLPDGARAEHWDNEAGKGIAFTTGPGGTQTHWMSAWMMVNRSNVDKSKLDALKLAKGQKIVGKVAYRRRLDNERQLDIEIEWAAAGTAEQGRQNWSLR